MLRNFLFRSKRKHWPKKEANNNKNITATTVIMKEKKVEERH